MRPRSLGLLVCGLAPAADALIGMDKRMYEPPCAYACARSLGSFMLSCSSHDAGGGGHVHGGSSMTSPSCRAGDAPYLTTLAWCVHTKCAEHAVPAAVLEKFWAAQATGDPSVAPKWTYGAALARVTQPPTRELSAGDEALNVTSLAPEAAWQTQFGTLTTVEYEETMHARYGVVLLTTGFATPILLTAVQRLPYMSRLRDRLAPYLIYPSALGTYQVRPLPFSLGNAPTVGQALYVALLAVLSVVLSAVSYRSHQPNAWFANARQEILAWVMYRTGVLAFALLPLVLLLAGRNSALLWLSDWSHATYVLLHRWAARLLGLLAVVHSVLALALYKDTGAYPAEERLPYWIWGAVATVAVSVMLVVSGLYARRWSYEAFLVLHVLLAVFVVVGCWYHVELRFERQFGYEMWIYAACAVWFFDRLVRVLRVLKAGVRRARVTEIGDDYVRVDIEGVRWGTAPGQHAYLYFPTLNPLRPWENHPFSLMPSSILAAPPLAKGKPDTPPSEPENTITADDDPEKHSPVNTTTHPLPRPAATPGGGITFIIRKSDGLTRSLRAHPSLLTLLDGPYPNNRPGAVLRCDRVLLVAGGIGITGVLPWAARASAAGLSARLCWSVRGGSPSARALVEHLAGDSGGGGALERVPEREVRVGTRFDVRALVEEELQAGWARIGVVVCGPGGLCDEVRAVVAEVGRRETGVVFELEVDAYSW